MNLCDPRIIRQLMEEAGLKFRHEFGQNFLIDPTIPEEIADACSDNEDTIILEIGPGIGCLTSCLAERYKKVVAIEIDNGLIPVLSKTLAEYDNVTIINGDCMKVDIRKILSEANGGGIPGIDFKVSVAANLPYYITTPILMQLLESGIPYSSITVMVQKEVADRLSAKAGSSDYGAITAVLGYYGETKKLFTVQPGAFLPPPKVSSSVVRIDMPQVRPFSPLSEKCFFDSIHAAFEQRRKTLPNSLMTHFSSLGKIKIEQAVTEAGFPLTIRGEKLSTADFVRLSDILFRFLTN